MQRCIVKPYCFQDQIFVERISLIYSNCIKNLILSLTVFFFCEIAQALDNLIHLDINELYVLFIALFKHVDFAFKLTTSYLITNSFNFLKTENKYKIKTNQNFANKIKPPLSLWMNEDTFVYKQSISRCTTLHEEYGLEVFFGLYRQQILLLSHFKTGL